MEPCTRPTVLLRGLRELPDGTVESFVYQPPCDSWQCPVCRERKARFLMARGCNGGMVDLVESTDNPYAYKLLTLTYGGKSDKKMTDNPYTQGYFCPLNNKARKDWRLTHPGEPLPLLYHPSRRYTGNADPEHCARYMAQAWNKLRTALRKYYGNFLYLRVVELHEDGYPHYHILLVGESIAPKSVLEHVTRLWRKYGLGFVKLNVIKDCDKGIRKTVSYVLKYMFKAPPIFDAPIRRYSAARGALQPLEKRVNGKTYFRTMDIGTHNGIHAVKWPGEKWEWFEEPKRWVSREQYNVDYPLVETQGCPF